MDYDEYIEACQTILGIPLNQTDSNFQNIVPRMIEYAEKRIYREMNFLQTTVGSSGTAFSAGDGRLSVPTQFIDVRYVNLITPAATQPDAGTRHPLQRVSPEVIDYAWPTATSTSGTALPSMYAMYGLTSGFTSTGAFTMRVAPAPTTAYVAEFIGPVYPTPLSRTNDETILTIRYPDLFLAASMVFGFAYQRDFGGSADAQNGVSWESTYKSLREGVMVEVERQKSESVGWSTQTPSVLADQPRPRTG